MLALLAAGPPLGHPRPRRRVPREDHTAFRCPAGPFLGERGMVDRTPRLQRHVRQALAHGLVPSLEDASTKLSQNATPFYTHESAAWPKPAFCRVRRPQVCAVNPHFCVILPYGNAPRTSLVSERHGIEFRQVWKVASSSLASFFFCNMWGDLRAEKLLPGTPPPQAPQPTAGLPPRRVVFPTREPIGRFVASSFEVLARLLNRVSPSGQRMPDDMFAEPGGPFSSTVLSATTRWYAPLQRVINATAEGGSRERAVLALVRGFIEDIECSVVYSSAEHLATQMSFVTSGYAERAALDFQLRLQNVSSDLERLGGLLQYERPRDAPPQNHTRWKCKLGRENAVENKGHMSVSKGDFVAVLAKHPNLVQRLCTVYFQDFIWRARAHPPRSPARPLLALPLLAAIRCEAHTTPHRAALAAPPPSPRLPDAATTCSPAPPAPVPRSLGFPLPPECEGGRELAWLDKPGKRAEAARSLPV
jgi:hypothetical protein